MSSNFAGKFQLSPFGSPIVDYLKISENAKLEIEKLLQARKEKCEGIKIGVKTRGCSGLSYVITYAVEKENISKFDDAIKLNDNYWVFIDPKASMFLIGSEMIFKSDELSSGFDFINPNEKGRCGCGESFKV